MKAGSKLTKKEQPKGDNTNGKEITNSEASSGLTTPEIMARSRKSLEGITMVNDEEKDQQMELMTEQFIQQQRELEDLTEASSKREPRTQASKVNSLQGNK
jgi:hypothetical protein